MKIFKVKEKDVVILNQPDIFVDMYLKSEADREIEQFKEVIDKSVHLAFEYGNIDGGHHKMWVIDQMVKMLMGNKYDQFVKEYCNGEGGPNTYEWGTGIAP